MWAGSGVTLLGMGHQEPGVGDVPFEGVGGANQQCGVCVCHVIPRQGSVLK